MKLFGYAILFVSMTSVPAFAQEEAADLSSYEASAIPSYAKIPASAKSSGDLTGSSRWFWSHDSGTPGSAVASSKYPVEDPSLDKKAREFNMSYSGKGGERFSLSFAHNAQVTHFVYDTYVYLEDPSELANLELDMNQVISNGKTVIFAFQCSGNTGQWEYSLIKSNHPKWQRGGFACSPKNWAAKKWHHIQIASHRDSKGDVTYDWVNFDGTYKELKNATGNGALSLHWGEGVLNLNFQLDGAKDRGSVKIYTDELTIRYW
jgi:hypothetical protein